MTHTDAMLSGSSAAKYHVLDGIGHRERTCQLHIFETCVCSRNFQILSALAAPAQAASALGRPSCSMCRLCT